MAKIAARSNFFTELSPSIGKAGDVGARAASRTMGHAYHEKN